MIVPSAERLQEGLFNIYSQALAPLPWTYERSQRIEGEYLRLKDALTLLDTLSQEVERLTNENQMLLTRVDSQRLSETTGSTALEKGR